MSSSDNNTNSIDPTDPATLNFETIPNKPSVAHPQKTELPAVERQNHFFSFSFYQKYFQVGSADVQRRLLKAVKIKGIDFLESEGGAPEVWGPLWITLTLPLLLFISSTLAGEWAGSVHSGSLDYSFLTYGLFLFVLFAVLEPLFLSNAIRKAFPSENDPFVQYFELMPLIMLTCYSWTIMGVSFALNVIPNRWWHLITIVLTSTVSGTFVWRNVGETLGKSTMPAQKIFSLQCLYTTIHSLLFFLIRILFY